MALHRRGRPSAKVEAKRADHADKLRLALASAGEQLVEPGTGTLAQAWRQEQDEAREWGPGRWKTFRLPRVGDEGDPVAALPAHVGGVVGGRRVVQPDDQQHRFLRRRDVA